MLISVLNIQLTSERRKLNYINTRTNVVVVLRVPSTLHVQPQRGTRLSRVQTRTDICNVRVIRHANQVQYVEPQEDHYLRNRSTSEECARLRESVPYFKLYRYNSKLLYPKWNGYGDNGHRKVWASGVSTYCTPSVTPYSSTAHARQRDTTS